MRELRRYCLLLIVGILPLATLCPASRGQEAATDVYVTRKEYEELKATMLAMKKELDALKKERTATSTQGAVESRSVADTHSHVAANEGEVLGETHKEVAAQPGRSIAELEASLFGTTKFLLAGWAEGMFEARNGQVSTFSASFNPIFLWELTPKILFDGRLEIEPS